MPKHLGTVEISLDLLRQFFKLPPEVKFLQVSQSWSQQVKGTFEVLVEAPTLLEVPNGNAIPYATIQLTASFCKADEITHLSSAIVKNI